jgi:hypothetical protein
VGGGDAHSRDWLYRLIEVNQYPSMTTISRLPITKARINLGQIALRAHNKNEYFILWTVPTSRFGHERLFASRILDSSVARSIQRSTSVFMTS